MVPYGIEAANGTADGVNQTFYTSAAYVASSVQVFLNGLLLRADLDDGYTLSAPNFVILKQAPLPEDVVQVYYQRQ